MSTFLEKVILGIIAAIAAAEALTNPWHLGIWQRSGVSFLLVCAAFPVAWVSEKYRPHKARRHSADDQPTGIGMTGEGGRGGGGNALGEQSIVIGGRGGRGGAFGRGGDGGGGDATGVGSRVIGGNGGDAGRIDGRGGKGGDSGLKRLSRDELRSWGLTGNEGYGQGGAAANTAEYDRSLRVLCTLSAEYIGSNPGAPLVHTPGVLMPPIEWMNGRLADLRESFRLELIDNGTDFLLQPNSAERP